MPVVVIAILAHTGSNKEKLTMERLWRRLLWGRWLLSMSDILIGCDVVLSRSSTSDWFPARQANNDEEDRPRRLSKLGVDQVFRLRRAE